MGILTIRKILESKIEQLEKSLNSENFFVHVSRYVDTLLEHSMILEVIESLEKSRDEAYEKYRSLENLALKEIDSAKEVIVASFEGGVSAKEVDDFLKKWQRIGEGLCSFEGPMVMNYEDFLLEFVEESVERGALNVEKIDQFLDSDRTKTIKERTICNFSFSEHYPKWRKEYKRLRNEKKFVDWEVWYILKYVPEVARSIGGGLPIEYAQLVLSKGETEQEYLRKCFQAMVVTKDNKTKQQKLREYYLDNVRSLTDFIISKLYLLLDENNDSEIVSHRAVYDKLPLFVGENKHIYIRGKVDPVCRKAHNRRYHFLKGSIEKCNDDCTVEVKAIYSYLVNLNGLWRKDRRLGDSASDEEQLRVLKGICAEIKREEIRNLEDFIMTNRRSEKFEWVV